MRICNEEVKAIILESERAHDFALRSKRGEICHLSSEIWFVITNCKGTSRSILSRLRISHSVHNETVYIKDVDFVDMCSNTQKEMFRKEVDHLSFSYRFRPINCQRFSSKTVTEGNYDKK